MIKSVQPYDVEQRGEAEQIVAAILNELNDLARKDRHRGLRVIASWVSNKNPSIESLPPGCSLEWLVVTEDGLLKEEGEVARFKISPSTEGQSRGLADASTASLLQRRDIRATDHTSRYIE